MSPLSCGSRFGGHWRKYHLRAVFQSIAFVSLVFGALIYHSGIKESQKLNSSRFESSGASFLRRDDETSAFFSVTKQHDRHEFTPLIFDQVVEDAVFMQHRLHRPTHHLNRRTLQPCEDIKKANPKWMLLFYIMGVLYMFLALAIVCDEFFVPALEEMASSHHLDLSMDVAGATLMAAGGSAPELFTSLFGTFQESEIGFGTIVGSAVFNVLFVLAMCAVFAKEVLQLTWWPLFRDSLCYTIGLIVLVTFMTYVSPGEIEWWESLFLFAMYWAYCFMMWKNAELYKYITGKDLIPSGELSPNDRDSPADEAFVEEIPRPADEIHDSQATNSIGSSGGPNMMPENQHLTTSSCISWQGTFRAGILRLLRDPGNWLEVGGIGIVAKMTGDVNTVFRNIDKNGDRFIDKEELRLLFDHLDAHVSPVDLEEVFYSLDENKDGVISEQEFQKWYSTSKDLIRSQAKSVFESLDRDKSGAIDKHEVKALLLELDPRVTDDDCARAIVEMCKDGSREEITFREFEEWYEHSIIYERKKKTIEEESKGVWESLKPPYGGGWVAWLMYIVVLPLIGPMTITIPDVRVQGRGKYCYLSFLISIGWIALFAYAMVSWAEIIGFTIGIPSVVMGLTVLAAGTSVPDLLTSVIVARRGSGDMAVSSSIGSNIFDILVGLPFPWLLYSAVYQDSVFIVLESVEINLILLIGMLVFLIASIHCQGWKLTRTLGVMMMIFYVGYLIQAIVQELPFVSCTKDSQ